MGCFISRCRRIRGNRAVDRRWRFGGRKEDSDSNGIELEGGLVGLCISVVNMVLAGETTLPLSRG
jgi:hypothetical protein